MHFKFRNINRAFTSMVSQVHTGHIPVVRTDTRNGPVMRIKDPVIITYEQPRERVLFNTGRDANPFFHLYEALWMLAGRNDLSPITYYIKDFGKYSDDGITLHGAYGYRWRAWFGWDQIEATIQELITNPQTRRVVVQHWDAMNMDEEDNNDFMIAVNGGLDVPCNLCILFDIQEGKLVMTVINRSNDLTFGAFGANVVHFSMLQEYIANCLGIEMGPYHQISNNLHIYTERWEPEKYLEGRLQDYDYTDDRVEQTVQPRLVMLGPNLVEDKYTFDRECKEVVQYFGEQRVNTALVGLKEPFLRTVAVPMLQAHQHHKIRDYSEAYNCLRRCQGQDWATAASLWLERREKKWLAKCGNNPDARGLADD